jgi:hypothetical protein
VITAPRGHPMMEYYNEPTNNDRWIIDIYKGKKGGYFVEAGALDGISGSCTYALERYLDWTGLLVEPGIYFERLVKNRPRSICANVCISDRTGPVIFIDSHDVGYSGIKNKLIQMEKKHERRWGKPKDQWRAKGSKERMAASIPFYDLLKKHNAPKTVDYLALDIEGSEYDALQDFPFHEYQIMAISIEGDSCNDLLLSRGYIEVKNPFNIKAPWEYYFLHKDLTNALPRKRHKKS